MICVRGAGVHPASTRSARVSGALAREGGDGDGVEKAGAAGRGELGRSVRQVGEYLGHVQAPAALCEADARRRYPPPRMFIRWPELFIHEVCTSSGLR